MLPDGESSITQLRDGFINGTDGTVHVPLQIEHDTFPVSFDSSTDPSA
jgi:hypothetical protein